MTSNFESELRAHVNEFAKSDETLKEIIGRLSELESLIAANQKSRESLDKSTTSINQLAANLGSFLTLSVDSVGNISKVSTDISSTIQRIEAGIAETVASNLNEATKEIRLAVSQFETLAKALSDENGSLNAKVEDLKGDLKNEINSNTTKLLIAVVIGILVSIGASLI
jgi:ABC-type transporter Mla subunit MlaD